MNKPVSNMKKYNTISFYEQLFILILGIDMLFMVVSFADSDFERFPMLLVVFVAIAFALYLTANKQS